MLCGGKEQKMVGGANVEEESHRRNNDTESDNNTGSIRRAGPVGLQAWSQNGLQVCMWIVLYAIEGQGGSGTVRQWTSDAP